MEASHLHQGFCGSRTGVQVDDHRDSPGMTFPVFPVESTGEKSILSFKTESVMFLWCFVLADAFKTTSCQISKGTRVPEVSRKDCFILKVSTAIREVEWGIN